MGGSILGAEAIYNFLQPKIKKKFYFFNNLDEDKISRLKREENLSKNFHNYLQVCNTIETLANAFALNIIKKIKKYNFNFRKKITYYFPYRKN